MTTTLPPPVKAETDPMQGWITLSEALDMTMMTAKVLEAPKRPAFTPTELADVLDRAADVIGRKGWTQGQSVHPITGGVCASEALLRAAYGAVHPAPAVAISDWQVALYQEAYYAFHRATGYNLIAYNDNLGASEVRVRAMLRAAAEKIRAKEVTQR